MKKQLSLGALALAPAVVPAAAQTSARVHERPDDVADRNNQPVAVAGPAGGGVSDSGSYVTLGHR